MSYLILLIIGIATALPSQPRPEYIPTPLDIDAGLPLSLVYISPPFSKDDKSKENDPIPKESAMSIRAGRDDESSEHARDEWTEKIEPHEETPKPQSTSDEGKQHEVEPHKESAKPKPGEVQVIVSPDEIKVPEPQVVPALPPQPPTVELTPVVIQEEGSNSWLPAWIPSFQWPSFQWPTLPSLSNLSLSNISGYFFNRPPAGARLVVYPY